jgi:hypothetical protein
MMTAKVHRMLACKFQTGQKLCKTSQRYSVVLAVVLEDCGVSFLLVRSAKKSPLTPPPLRFRVCGVAMMRVLTQYGASSGAGNRRRAQHSGATTYVVVSCMCTSDRLHLVHGLRYTSY